MTDFIVQGILPSVVVGLITYAWTFVARKTPERLRWRLADAERVLIFVSQSAETHTGQYVRPATGIGQAKALGIIAPSLSRAYRGIDLQDTRFPYERSGRDLERDLIVLGGPKNNEVTAMLLEAYSSELAVGQCDDTIKVGTASFTGEVVAGTVVKDYGLIVSGPNPYSRDHRATILSGSHTYGTVAAARWFVENHKPSFRQNQTMVVVVECVVSNQHAVGIKPSWSLEDGNRSLGSFHPV